MSILVCSFCARHRRNVGKLISGPRVFICDGCVGVCIELQSGRTPQSDLPRPRLETGGVSDECLAAATSALRRMPVSEFVSRHLEDLTSDPHVGAFLDTFEQQRARASRNDKRLLPSQECSFCGKVLGDVRVHFVGPGARICDECVGLCTDIIGEAADADRQPSPSASQWAVFMLVVEQVIRGMPLSEFVARHVRDPAWQNVEKLLSRSRELSASANPLTASLQRNIQERVQEPTVGEVVDAVERATEDMVADVVPNDPAGA